MWPEPTEWLRGDISGNRREIEGLPNPSKETCLDVWLGTSTILAERISPAN